MHLPAIVDAAESSPSAAKAAANTIGHYLSKDHYRRGFAQYNAIMLLRILTDNPGPPFTQNFDTKFVAIVKSLLRDGKDTSVQQILRETLDYFEAEKARGDDKLDPLIQMWRKEKSKSARFNQGPAVSHGMSDVFVPHDTHTSQYPQYSANTQQYQSRGSRPIRSLPPADELAARIEEAKTTARLLIQTVQSTPQAELPANDLVKEFAERARSAHKSIQTYMNCENPAPDEDTMLTLIETNDQLNVAMSKHQRALLQARKAAGLGTPSPQPAGQEGQSYMQPHAQRQESQSFMQPHTQGQNVYQNVYNVPEPQAAAKQQSNYGPYSSSPPRRNIDTFSPVSPVRAPTAPSKQNETFAAPPGPPPNRTTTQPLSPQRQPTYEYEDAYAGSSPPRVRKEAEVTNPTQPPLVHTTSAAEYGVPENPFADDAAEESQPYQQPQPPQQQQTYSFLDRASHNISSNSNSGSPVKASAANNDDDTRPAPFQPTQSYMNRQDSSANHLTMHGGSPAAGVTREREV